MNGTNARLGPTGGLADRGCLACIAEDAVGSAQTLRQQKGREYARPFAVLV